MVFRSADERESRRRAREADEATKKVLVSGDETAVSGVTVGVYLFRNGALT